MMVKTKMALVLCLFIGLSVFFIAAPASAVLITVDFDPSSIITAPGDTFSLDLIASVDPTSAIASFGLDITFDAAILDTTDAVVNASIFGGSAVDFGTDGLIELTGFVFPPPLGLGSVSGSLTLASLTFLAEAVGTTALTSGINPLEPTEGFGLPFPPGGTVPLNEITLNSGSVTVNPGSAVPEPTTIFLFGIGLVGIAGFRFRKKTRKG